MALDPRQLKEAIERADHPLGVKELLRALGLNPGYQTDLKRALRELLRTGSVRKDGKRFSSTARPRPREDKPHNGPLAAKHGDVRAAPEHRGPAPKHKVQAQGGGSAPRFGRNRGGKPERRGGVDGARGFKPRQERSPPPSRGRRGGGGGRGGAGGPMVEGILHVHRDGFGFVHPLDSTQENIFLPAGEAGRALDNDRVRVEVREGDRGRFYGKLVEVVNRVRQHVVGTYFDRGRQSFVVPHDVSLGGGAIRVPATQIARDGDLVRVHLGVGKDMLEEPGALFGEVSGSLGRPGEPSGEVLGIAFSQGFSDEFPSEVMAEADGVTLHVRPEDWEGRRDLRSIRLVTIDGEDARDFDDAVYVEERSDGWRLVVAIADVTYYVRSGTPLDVEALRRATSVYLPNRVLPMLPERLSNGICSLKPNEDRLCMVADMQISRSGLLGSCEVYPAVMRSAARCTYNEVQDVLDGKDVPHRNEFKPDFQRLLKLSQALTKMREERGAIDFDIAETKMVLADDGRPQRIERRERKASHRLIEECMLAANEAVAKFFQEASLPSIYRFHADPDEEKLASFAAMAAAHGFNLGKGGQIASRELNAFVKKLHGHPEQRALNQLLLRSMKQAVYSAENVGHYGLGAEHYLHFTSPIRRYPDLAVHRLLKQHWARAEKGRPENLVEEETAQLEEAALQSSERERAAMQVEREVFAFYATLLMKERVGEEFAAIVAGVADFGFFVELEVELAEGLIRAESVSSGFRFDERRHALVYPNGRSVTVGQKLTVRLLSANVARRQLEFEVVAFEGAAPKAPAGAVAEERSPQGGSAHPGFDRLRRQAAEKRGGSAPASPQKRQGGSRFDGSKKSRGQKPRGRR